MLMVLAPRAQEVVSERLHCAGDASIAAARRTIATSHAAMFACVRGRAVRASPAGVCAPARETQATIFPQKDGSNVWTFDLVGIYHVNDPRLKGEEGALFFNWDYFDQATQFGGGKAGWYVLRVAQPKDADRVARAIDTLSANSDHETKTQSEDAFQTSFVSQFADIGLIVGSIMGAVFFTLILLTGNTMAQAVRERIPELAILKTIGFSNRSVLALVLAESVLLLALGGAIGLLISGAVVSGIRAKLGPQFPMLPVGGDAWAEGIALMVIIGLVVGALPARRGMKLRIIDALSGR